MQNAQRRSGAARRLRQTFAVFCVLTGLISGPASALTVEEITSEKGIKAWLVEEHNVPLIAIKFAFMGEASQEPERKAGLADIMSDLLTEGAADLAAADFTD